MRCTCAASAGDLGLVFSGIYLLTSAGKDFPVLVEIARLLPDEDYAQERALRNTEFAQLAMRITDRRVDASVRQKTRGPQGFDRERSLMVNGQLQRLRTLRHPELHASLASRGIVVRRSMSLPALRGAAEEYLDVCKDKLRDNMKRLKAMALHC